MGKDKFMWEEGDLEIEHPIGSGIFIPLREFNRLMDEEDARKEAEKAADGEAAAEEKGGEET